MNDKTDSNKERIARLIEHIVGLAALAFLMLGILYYAFQEPYRIGTAQAAQLAADLDSAMTLYAENCAVCHGIQGEGIGATPALNSTALQGAESDALIKIISRGLYDTAMPAWSKEDGGPLSDYQILELVSLIQYGNWSSVQDRVVNLGLSPLIPFTTQPDQEILDAVALLPEGAILAQGVTLYSEQCVACHGADGLGGSLAPALNDALVREKGADEVERIILNGVSGTLMASWKQALDAAEVNALVSLIMRWEEVPVGAIPAPDRPVPVTAESLQLGASLYAQSCSRCHGPTGQGTQRAPALNVSGFLVDTNDVALQQIITLGVPGTAMPVWGDRLTDAEIQAVVGFIRSWEPTAPEVAVPTRMGGPWWSAGSSTTSSVNTLPSGGVQQPTPTGAAASSDAAVNNSAASHDPNAQGTGGPPWQTQTDAGQTTSWDWRIQLLLGGLGLVSLLLIGISFYGLHSLRRKTG